MESAHADNQCDLNQAEVDNSALRASDGAEVAVLASAEVLLVASDGRELARDLEEGLLESGCLFGGGTGLRWQVNLGLVLDLLCLC